MKEEKNSFTQQQVEQFLQEQKEQGFPNFKKRIADVLAEEFAVPLSTARAHVDHPDIAGGIDKDIEWAQHMGTRYWAELIYESYLDIPKLQLS